MVTSGSAYAGRYWLDHRVALGAPEARIGLDAGEAVGPRGLHLAARSFGAGQRAHAVGALGRRGDRRAELVGHEVLHPAVVPLRPDARDRPHALREVVARVHAVGVVVDGVHPQVGVEDEIRTLRGVRHLRGMPVGRGHIHAGPPGVDRECFLVVGRRGGSWRPPASTCRCRRIGVGRPERVTRRAPRCACCPPRPSPTGSGTHTTPS